MDGGTESEEKKGRGVTYWRSRRTRSKVPLASAFSTASSPSKAVTMLVYPKPDQTWRYGRLAERCTDAERSNSRSRMRAPTRLEGRNVEVSGFVLERKMRVDYAYQLIRLSSTRRMERGYFCGRRRNASHVQGQLRVPPRREKCTVLTRASSGSISDRGLGLRDGIFDVPLGTGATAS